MTREEREAAATVVGVKLPATPAAAVGGRAAKGGVFPYQPAKGESKSKGKGRSRPYPTPTYDSRSWRDTRESWESSWWGSGWQQQGWTPRCQLRLWRLPVVIGCNYCERNA